MFIRYNTSTHIYERDTSAGSDGSGPWVALELDASILNEGTVNLARISGITNTQIAAGAAIAYAKLALALSIVDGDISNSAAIAWSKISKSGSSLADLATRSAGDLSSGTLPDAQFPTTLPVTGTAAATPTLTRVYSDSIITAWLAATDSAGTPTITDDYNVSSITDNNVGDYTINFATALGAATYAAVGTITVVAGTNPHVRIHTKSTGSVRILIFFNASATDASFNLIVVGP